MTIVFLMGVGLFSAIRGLACLMCMVFPAGILIPRAPFTPHQLHAILKIMVFHWSRKIYAT